MKGHALLQRARRSEFLLLARAPGLPAGLPCLAGLEGRLVMKVPEEIEEREHEIAVARVAAVDVAKASGVISRRVPPGYVLVYYAAREVREIFFGSEQS